MHVETLTVRPEGTQDIVEYLRGIGYEPIVTRLDTGDDHIAYDLDVYVDQEG